jgi:hypothetical protein
MATLDLTPDPKVLVALTRTPMLPLDALCELIDNCIDGFEAARRSGVPIDEPTVIVELPTRSEIEQHRTGRVVIRDNGPGMDVQTAEKALRAGYSGNNAYDSLGLFGMGFNISTGKLGRRTTLTSCQRNESEAIRVEIDLEQIQQRRCFQVPFTRIERPQGFSSGTAIEINGWWPIGDANANFPLNLVKHGLAKIRAELGRRYATILRKPIGSNGSPMRLMVNRQLVTAFEHCIWGENRFVERERIGRVYAVQKFEETLDRTTRCAACTAVLAMGATRCEQCGGGATRTIEERIKGWVGIQRYDDNTHYGIDLIRNGRAIRVAEKEAFFEFRDELGEVTKDYPIDSTFGRIVGEVHLDHVPVDFLKQDFQRTSTEWVKAIQFLRGTTSLQPSRWENGSQNSSPISKLYQGYRRVRKYGTGDMYMGVFDGGKAGRIAREVEKDMLQKFNDRVPGYYPDDAEWWKHVLAADTPPLPSLSKCPNCQSENLEGSSSCLACGQLLVGQPCVSPTCAKLIPSGSETCPHCETPQAIRELSPWQCLVCSADNVAGASLCRACNSSKGTPNPLSREVLRAESDLYDELAVAALVVRLADGRNADPLDVEVRRTRKPMIANYKGERQEVPVVCFREVGRLEMFLSPNHYVFSRLGLMPQTAISFEVADYLLNQHAAIRSRYPNTHALQNLAALIMQQRWGGDLAPSTSDLREESRSFFDEIRSKLVLIFGDRYKDVIDVMAESESREMMQRVIAKHPNTDSARIIASPDVLRFIPEHAIGNIVTSLPGDLMNGSLFRISTSIPENMPPDLGQQIIDRSIRFARSCLEDAATLAAESSTSDEERRRATLSLAILKSMTGIA